MSRLTRMLTAVPVAAALALSAAPGSATAEPDVRPDRIDLVTGSMPEGIAAGPDGTFFAGARSDGAIYRGQVDSDRVETFVEGDGEGPAVGMKYDDRVDLLWVAGGTGGDVTAYDGTTGVERFVADTGEGRFLNDVAITEDAVYVTDSRSAELIVIDTTNGVPPANGTFRTLPLTGEFVPAVEGAFGLNGIRELPDGDLVLVSEGVLYAVDPGAGEADVLEVRGRQLSAGDGLVLDGQTLYVVNGYGGDEVAVLRLGSDGGTAQAVGVLRDRDLDRPTTGAIVDGSLYVVNGRFETIAQDPDAPVYVSRLRLRS